MRFISRPVAGDKHRGQIISPEHPATTSSLCVSDSLVSGQAETARTPVSAPLSKQTVFVRMAFFSSIRKSRSLTERNAEN